MEWLDNKKIRAKSLSDVEELNKMNCVIIDECFLIDYAISDVVTFAFNNKMINADQFNVFDKDACV